MYKGHVRGEQKVITCCIHNYILSSLDSFSGWGEWEGLIQDVEIWYHVTLTEGRQIVWLVVLLIISRSKYFKYHPAPSCRHLAQSQLSHFDKNAIFKKKSRLWIVNIKSELLLFNELQWWMCKTVENLKINLHTYISFFPL